MKNMYAYELGNKLVFDYCEGNKVHELCGEIGDLIDFLFNDAEILARIIIEIDKIFFLNNQLIKKNEAMKKINYYSDLMTKRKENHYVIILVMWYCEFCVEYYYEKNIDKICQLLEFWITEEKLFDGLDLLESKELIKYILITEIVNRKNLYIRELEILEKNKNTECEDFSEAIEILVNNKSKILDLSFEFKIWKNYFLSATLGKNEYTEAVVIKSMSQLMNYEFLLIVQKNSLKKCKICGKIFTPLNKSDEIYCNKRVSSMLGDEMSLEDILNLKTCKDIGASKRYREKLRSNQGFNQYNNNRTKYHNWVWNNQLDSKVYENWLDRAKDKKKEYVEKEITLEDFLEYLKNEDKEMNQRKKNVIRKRM